METDKTIVEDITDRVKVLFGHYRCPDCYYPTCHTRCGRRFQKELSQISRVIGLEKFDEARALIKELELKTCEDEPEITRLKTLMAFLEGDD